MANPNESQQMKAVVDEEGYKIPTRAEHKRLIWRLWKWCLSLAVIVFLGTASTMVTLWTLGYSPSEVLDYSTTSFQVLVLSYGMGFFIPILVTSVLMVALGIEMNRQALVLGSRSATVLDKIDKAIDNRLVRADRILDGLDDLVKGAEKAEHPLMDRFEKFFSGELEKLRSEVRNQRKETEGEMEEALAEGEREAAEIAAGGDGQPVEWPPCPYCGQQHEGPCMGLDRRPCGVCGKQHETQKCPECKMCSTGAGPHLHHKI